MDKRNSMQQNIEKEADKVGCRNMALANKRDSSHINRPVGFKGCFQMQTMTSKTPNKD